MGAYSHVPKEIALCDGLLLLFCLLLAEIIPVMHALGALEPPSLQISFWKTGIHCVYRFYQVWSLDSNGRNLEGAPVRFQRFQNLPRN